jgi:hypothetical protein
VKEGVRQTKHAAAMTDFPRIARARVEHNHRMNKKPDVAPVADHAEAAFARLMARIIELRGVLDRQNMAPLRRLGRARGRVRHHDFARHSVIVQKTPKALRPRSVSAEAAQTRTSFAHKGGQQIGPPFWSRSSPNRPKSVIPCIARSSRESSQHSQ